jgi:RNA polymerase sigma-70 factor (ECF subfamily)
MVLAAGSEPAKPAAAALERLARRYWPPIYAYVRRTGRDVHEAADVTQGFLCDVVLSRRLVASADPARGRFRSLLLGALRNYLAAQHRHESRQSRRPPGGTARSGVVRLHEGEVIALDAQKDASPEQAFIAQWCATLVRRVLDDVRRRCHADGLAAHWAVFEARIVRPMLLGEAPLPHSALVTRLNLDDSAQAANMMVTVKRRLAQAICREVGRTVQDRGAIEDELLDLLRHLERT